MAVDIAYTIFVGLFGMMAYPGAPFTGNLMRDLILFILVPSVFIILFIYMVLGRLFSASSGTQLKLRVLVGVTMYVFIVASGFYPAFAYLAGPYFIFLIFILGLIYFIPGHFGFRHEGAGHFPESAGGYQKRGRGMTPGGRITYLRKELARAEADLVTAETHGSKDRAMYLQQKIDEIREEIEDEESRAQPWRRRRA